MRYARSLAILLTCILLAGCGGSKPSGGGAVPPATAASAPAAPRVEPAAPSAQAPAAPAIEPAAPSAPAPAAPAVEPAAPSAQASDARLRALCADLKAFKRDISPTAFIDALRPLLGTQSPAEVKSALEGVNKAVGMACYVADASEAREPPLVLASFRFTDQRVIAWRPGEKWQVAPVKSLSDMSQILAQSSGSAGREVLFSTSSEGTGHYGSFGLLRLKDGEWQTLFQSPTYDHFGATLLDPDHVLVLARNVGDAPLAWPFNYAIPTNYQWLWQRKGDTFAIAAERLVPDPAYIISVFFGALQQGKQDWLAKVSTPEAVAGARKLKLDDPAVKLSPPNAMSVGAKDEYLYWSALPEGSRGPAPAVTTGTATVPVANGAVPVVQLGLQRTDKGWVVTSVEPVR